MKVTISFGVDSARLADPVFLGALAAVMEAAGSAAVSVSPGATVPPVSLPEPPREHEPARRPQPRRGPDAAEAPPRNGKALWAFLRDQEERGSRDLIRCAAEFGKANDFPARITAWDRDQVRECYAALMQTN